VSLSERPESNPSAADPFTELVAAFERDARQDISRIVERRFAELSAALRPRVAQERLDVVRALAQALNQSFVRMRRYESDWQWCDALLDAAATVSGRAAFFSIRGENLCFQGARGLEDERRTAPLETPLESAPAFSNAARACMPLEARKTPAHLSSAIAGLFGENANATVALIPVVAAGSAAGILYVEDAVEMSALESIATFAGATLEARLPPPQPEPAPQPQPAAAQIDEDLLSPLDLRAGRFARVETAKLVLEHSGALRRGRESRNIYGALKTEIDAVRQEYRRRFPGGTDFIHDELLRTLAQNDPEALGGQYPGPLI
jgi:hypothetical protein